MSVPAGLLPELPTLLVIAEELHFGRAAARLNISQPRVSQIVRRMEDVLGYRIFDRRPRVRLTAAGELLIKTAQDALAEFQAGLSRARDVADGRRGTVRVGFAPVSMLTRLPHILKSFREWNPHVELRLQTTYASNLWAEFDAGKYDLIVSREVRNMAGVDCQLFVRDSLVVAMAENDPLATAAVLSIAALADYDFVTSEHEIAPQWHETITSLCRQAGFVPHITQRTNDWGAMLALVASGLGASIVSSTVAQIHFPGVRFVPLKEGVGVGSLWIASQRDIADPAAKMLLSELLRGVGDRTPDPVVV